MHMVLFLFYNFAMATTTTVSVVYKYNFIINISLLTISGLKNITAYKSFYQIYFRIYKNAV